jgi:hypothetical protein
MLMRGYVKIAGFDDSDAAEFQSSCMSRLRAVLWMVWHRPD